MSSNDVNDFEYCQVDDCPSPQVPHHQGDYLLDDKGSVMCLFCVARLKSSVVSEEWQPKETKKVDAVAEERIPPPTVLNQNYESFGSAERIPPQLDEEQLAEEKDVWKIAINILETKLSTNLGVFEHVTTLSQLNHPRIVTTNRKSFLVRLAKSSLQQLDVLPNQILDFIEDQPEAINHYVKLEDFPARFKNWVEHSWGVMIESLEESNVVFSEPPGTIIPFEQLSDEQAPPLAFLEKIAFELGRWVYIGWFLGNKNTMAVVLINQPSLDSISFLALQSFEASNSFDPKMLNDLILNFSTSIPWLLDIECKQKFIDGASAIKSQLQAKIINIKEKENLKTSFDRLTNNINSFVNDLNNWPELNF